MFQYNMCNRLRKKGQAVEDATRFFGSALRKSRYLFWWQKYAGAHFCCSCTNPYSSLTFLLLLPTLFSCTVVYPKNIKTFLEGKATCRLRKSPKENRYILYTAGNTFKSLAIIRRRLQPVCMCHSVSTKCYLSLNTVLIIFDFTLVASFLTLFIFIFSL
jgi:hypothetical protein